MGCGYDNLLGFGSLCNLAGNSDVITFSVMRPAEVKMEMRPRRSSCFPYLTSSHFLSRLAPRAI